MPRTCDFSGWATRNDLKCADGRTIRKDAFKAQDGQSVPLVWMHQHDNPENVLGHAILENRDEGVYAYGYFNDTDTGRNAKEMVKHRDVTNLSIYANQLKQKGGDVMHGVIREVSLVLAGANPGALIDFPVLAHGEEADDEAVIYNDYDLELSHADEEDKGKEAEDETKETNDMPNNQPGGDKTVKDIFDSMTEEQKNVVYFMIGKALEDKKGGAKDNTDEKEGEEMSHNVFERDNARNTLSHADTEQIFADAKRMGSLKAAWEAFSEANGLAHSVYNSDGSVQEYGIADIGVLFPDYKNIENQPGFIKRNDEWVSVVMNGVRHTPFSRIKSVFANITMDEARAKGYVKGKRKAEEVFSLLRRTTDPQTIYKKQKLDRDDVIDITDFDIVAYMKSEMRAMLEEEAARAILVGDGRLASDDDKIFPNHIRPIWGDDELYTIRVPVVAGEDDAATAKNIIRQMIKQRKNYKGSGNVTFFTTEDWLSEMLLLEDGFGHALYKDAPELATKLRVNRIVTSPVLENQTADDGEKLIGIAVDLRDYNVGADKGGSVQMFDDFDIDYNQMKYLIETRFSGALIKPFSAMAVTTGTGATTYTQAEYNAGTNPFETGLYEKQGDIYVVSNDRTMKSSKTYYTKAKA